MSEIQYFMADPPHVLSTDKMWMEEVASIYHFCQGRGLDIGAGGRTISPDVERLDVNPSSRPEYPDDATKLALRNQYDFVYAGHFLEHVQDARDMLARMIQAVKPGGYVILVLPERRYTLSQNTDATPHRHEWTPREFLDEVLDWDVNGVPWFKAAPFETLFGASCVQVEEACPSWSYNVVLRRDQENCP